MKKFILLFLCFCLVMPMQVFATELVPEETIEEVVDEMVDEVINTEAVESTPEMLEKLDAINQNLFIIEITLLFMVGTHYVEKWLKLALSSMKDSGRVM